LITNPWEKMLSVKAALDIIENKLIKS